LGGLEGGPKVAGLGAGVYGEGVSILEKGALSRVGPRPQLVHVP
jgi:hypothetical protein